MLKKIVTICVVCFFILGCETTKLRVGSERWHQQRIAEIEEALANKEIGKAKYLELKNQADDVRAIYLHNRDTHSHIDVGYRHGAHVGVGVGF